MTSIVSKNSLSGGWKKQLAAEFKKTYMTGLEQFLADRKSQGATIYPPAAKVFSAFTHTKWDDVKVVLLGQDPYHGPGQAHGLSFSVPPGQKTPPSLKNIYKELSRDFGVLITDNAFESGSLVHWAAQGVLLLNSVLTVESGQAGAHRKKGWEQFTDAVIQTLAEEKEHIVFFLWGSYAQKKGAFIDKKRHCVLEAPHPSPLSAYRGFLGCGHFRACNQYLEKHGQKSIDWVLQK
jgi:uracil-DNA glycosylase